MFAPMNRMNNCIGVFALKIKLNGLCPTEQLVSSVRCEELPPIKPLYTLKRSFHVSLNITG
jgi:hypothetical protein